MPEYLNVNFNNLFYIPNNKHLKICIFINKKNLKFIQIKYNLYYVRDDIQKMFIHIH